MKKIIKSKKVICIIFTAIVLFASSILSTNVYAANDNLKTSLNVNNSQVKQGENVIVTIALSNISIESGEKGIGAYTAKLDFDSSVLEYVSTSGTSNWEAPLYEETLIVGNTNNGKVVNSAQDIGTITFKVKENATLGETTIKLTKFSGSTAETDVTAEDSTIKITIVAKQSENQGSGTGSEGSGATSGNQSGNTGAGGNGDVNGNSNGNQGSNTPTNGNQTGNTGINGNGSGNTNTNTNNNTTNNNSNNSNGEDIKSGTLPKTGSSNIVIYILISVFALIATIYWIRIKLINKRIGL